MVFDTDAIEPLAKPFRPEDLQVLPRYANSDDVLDIPKSKPWYAPDGVIEGGIAPQDTPVVDPKSPKYTAKTTDFGYSTQYSDVSDLIIMPKSDPWYAPEWHHRGFTPAQAAKMDSYSFGMLVLWLLSYSTEEDSIRKFKVDLHLSSDDALSLAYGWAEHLQPEKESAIRKFFGKTLTPIVPDRCSDFVHLRDILGSGLYTAIRPDCEGG